MVKSAERVESIIVTSELEALLLEAHLIKKFKPFFNVQAKDDKHPLYIKITTKDKYPRVFTTRREDPPRLARSSGEASGPRAAYFGPFPSSQTVKDILKLLRSIFPYDTQNKIGKRPCFWRHIGLCDPCPSEIEKLNGPQKTSERARYRRNIRNLLAVLSRKTPRVRDGLTKLMLSASKNLDYEEAIKIRNQITKLDYITTEYRSVSSFLENPNLITDIRSQESEALKLLITTHYPLITILHRIECFDASHTGMVNPTVGMVTFVDGEPDKSLYRKFKIKGKIIDDLSFIEEGLRRRFTHPEWGNPDLLIIDGGKLQVGRAREVIRELRLKVPVVGIVKPFDDLVIPHKEGFIIKRTQGPSRALIQRLRDEAHRFAKAYHTKLRAKRVLYE